MVKTAGQDYGLKIKHAEIGERTVNAKAVLIAAGGFQANKEMLAKYAPEVLDLKTTNHPGATGDGMKLATAVGGTLVDMSSDSNYPTAQQDIKITYLIGEGVW